jgi:hypothetical protein
LERWARITGRPLTRSKEVCDSTSKNGENGLRYLLLDAALRFQMLARNTDDCPVSSDSRSRPNDGPNGLASGLPKLARGRQ